MASVVHDPNGFKRVMFRGLDRKRHPIRLGKCSEMFAITVAGHVEEIVNAAIRNQPHPRATAEWLAELSPVLEEKFVAVGLILPSEKSRSVTLGEFLDSYLARRSDVKESTRVTFGNTRRNLIEVFGTDRLLDSITPADADDFRRALQHRDGGNKSKSGPLSVGVKLFDAAVAMRNDSGQAARSLKAQWLKSPKLPQPVGEIYQSRRIELYSLDSLMAFLRETESEPSVGWKAIREQLQSRQLKPTTKTKRPLSAVTVARRCGVAKQFFRDAVRRKLISSNPFDDVAGGPKSNAANSQFIDQSTINRVIEACPNAEWRLLVALSRFGGLRIPSEALLLKWSDFDIPGGG